MSVSKYIYWGLAALLFYSCETVNESNKVIESNPCKVEIISDGDSYTLLKDGKEFFIKGAGCEHGNIPSLAIHGANSFRTWRTDNGQISGKEVLDIALENNLFVTMGLEIARERHGFDYNDEAAVKKQFEEVKNQILQYKDHPSLLIWAIGNELNLRAKNPKVWDAVNDIAQMIHEIDPNHIVTTTIAGANKRDIQLVKERCPNIDILSFQLYATVVNLPRYIKEGGWEGPYLVTEWGASGHWEVGRTIWDRPFEQTSSEKRDAYLERYNIAIASDPDHCLGSYAFLWGQKQERTPTWYGMFLESGEETPSVDAMHYIWTGNWPENLSPDLKSITLDNKAAFENIYLESGTEYSAKTIVTDHDGDQLSFKWEIREEVTQLSDGGDFEPSARILSGLISEEQDNSISLIAPKTTGAYRLFVYVFDGNNNAATANIPFFVN